MLRMTIFDTTFNDLLAKLNLNVGMLVATGARLLIICVGGWLAYWLVDLASRRIEKAVDDGDPNTNTLREKRGHTIAQLMRSFGKVIVLALTALLALNVFINIGPLLAGVGVLGLAVSFGSQSLVKDIITGFFMLMEGSFSVGDIIEVAGKGGVVEKVTLRTVTLRDVEGVMHVIPSGQIDVVSNKTAGWSRAVLDLGVAYGADLDKAIAVTRSELEAFKADETWGALLDGDPEMWGVEKLGDSAVVIRVVIRTKPSRQWNVAREFRRRWKNRCDQEGIEIPFPQRTLWVRTEAGQPVHDAVAAFAARDTE